MIDSPTPGPPRRDHRQVLAAIWRWRRGGTCRVIWCRGTRRGSGIGLVQGRDVPGDVRRGTPRRPPGRTRSTPGCTSCCPWTPRWCARTSTRRALVAAARTQGPNRMTRRCPGRADRPRDRPLPRRADREDPHPDRPVLPARHGPALARAERGQPPPAATPGGLPARRSSDALHRLRLGRAGNQTAGCPGHGPGDRSSADLQSMSRRRSSPTSLNLNPHQAPSGTIAASLGDMASSSPRISAGVAIWIVRERCSVPPPRSATGSRR